MEKVEITCEHITIIREKYDCSNMSDEQIINAMLHYEKRDTGKGVWILEALCFPDFQSYLIHQKNIFRDGKFKI